MPLLNLGYALGGLSQGYNTAQQQAMQRAAYQLQLQQLQSQQNAQRLAGQALAAGLLGKGGGLGGLGSGFNPANIQAPAPIPGVTTPSPTPPPPVAQQPPSASPPSGGSGVGFSPDPAYDPFLLSPPAPSQAEAPDSSLRNPETIPLDTPSNGASGPEGAVGPPGPAGASTLTSDATRAAWGQRNLQPLPASDPEPIPSDFASPGKPITPQQQANFDATHAAWAKRNPAGGATSSTAPASSTTAAPSTTAPASTTSDASSGTGGGDSYAVKIPGGPSIPLSTFFDTIDYGHLAQGIAKLAPPGTDQADIYQAVVDLSKLAEGNRTQQQQAGLILRELIKQPFDLEKIATRGQQASELETQRQAGRTDLETQRQSGRTGLETQRQAGRSDLETRREAFRAESQQRSRDFQVAQQQRRFDNQTMQRIAAHAQKMEDEATKRGLDAAKRQAQLIRQEINSYVNRYVDLTSPKTPTEVKTRVEALIKQLDQLNTQLFNTGQPND